MRAGSPRASTSAALRAILLRAHGRTIVGRRRSRRCRACHRGAGRSNPRRPSRWRRRISLASRRHARRRAVGAARAPPRYRGSRTARRRRQCPDRRGKGRACTRRSRWAAEAASRRRTGNLLSAPSSLLGARPARSRAADLRRRPRRAGVRIARANMTRPPPSYRGTVLTAFREVEDDLARARYLATQEQRPARATWRSPATRRRAHPRPGDVLMQTALPRRRGAIISKSCTAQTASALDANSQRMKIACWTCGVRAAQHEIHSDDKAASADHGRRLLSKGRAMIGPICPA
jgi:hypothetical protein